MHYFTEFKAVNNTVPKGTDVEQYLPPVWLTPAMLLRCCDSSIRYIWYFTQ